MNCIPRETFEPQDYLDDLLCPLGLGVMRDPVALPCQHVFCRGCLESKSNTTLACPQCSKAYQKEQVKPQIQTADIINQASVKCPQCSWVGPYQTLEKHKASKCPNVWVPCPHKCGEICRASDLPAHEARCTYGQTKCSFCQQTIAQKVLKEHEAGCSEREIDCPLKCGKRVKLRELVPHSSVCSKSSALCIFAFAGCLYVPGSGEDSLEAHCAKSIGKHLELLSAAVARLKRQLNQVEGKTVEEDKGLPPSPSKTGTQTAIELSWNTGQMLAFGKDKGTWSFYLSNKMILCPFLANIRVISLSDMSSLWKVCIGVFSSANFLAGCWDKFKNGWGYILGTGQKIFDGLPLAYGESCNPGDTVTIESSFTPLSFYDPASYHMFLLLIGY